MKLNFRELPKHVKTLKKPPPVRFNENGTTQKIQCPFCHHHIKFSRYPICTKCTKKLEKIYQ